MKHKKILSLLLVFALLAGMLPGMTLSAFAADKCEITVADSAPKTLETTQGALLKVKLSDMFDDSEVHELTYALAGDYVTQTKIAANEEDGGAMYLYFTSPDAGTVDVQLKASCKSDPTVSATHTIAVTVKKGESGDASQYGYDETPADSVKVYVTVSNNGVPIKGCDGTILSHLEVEIPYFDLDKQGLSDFYRYHTENGEGAYIDEEIVERPTLLHLYLYMLGVYYLGLDPEDVTKGRTTITEQDGLGGGVMDMFDGLAYEDTMLALNITGSATSMYMHQFWGHDENLMYYRNHVYPLMSAGWGSTADYILLSDGDTIDLAMFSNWSFWTYGAFATFDHDDYALATDGSVQFKTVKYDTRSVADGGTEEFEPITGLNVAVYDEDWTRLDEIQPDEAEGSEYTLNAAELGLKAGTYYLLAIDPNASTDDACYAPATALVTVTGGTAPCTHETTETVYAAHSPVDSKFDEIKKCTACGEQVGETVEHVYGDVNGDGNVNVQDVIYLRNALKNNTELTAYQCFAADVNADGTVNTADTLVLSATMRNNSPFKGTKLPVATKITYTNTASGQHKVTVFTEDGQTEIGSDTEACADENDDGKCDKCNARMPGAACEHTETESTFKKHDPKDGKFDEIVKCKSCGEQVGETVEHYYGDVNGDGQFAAGEFQALIPIVRQGGKLPTEWQNFACDVNEDGKIDDDDIALISALGRNAIILPTSTERAYVYYKQDNGVEKHYKTISLPDYPDADLSAIYRLNEACTDEDGDGRCDLCLHCTHKTTEVKNAVEATCGADGYTGDTVCTVCGETVTEGTVIPATGEHVDANSDGICDVCGAVLSVPVPTRKEGYPAETSDTVKTGMAYLLSDLQAGKIFAPVEGQSLNYRNYYYQRSTDGGETWGQMMDFSEAIFGMTTIQLTENEAGTYVYRFYASHDGVHFSTDTWTLTLTVEDEPTLDFSFFVGKDYTGGYPIIKLYDVTTDGEGNEVLGDEIENVFLYSNFTDTLPEGEEEYDPALGKLVSNYQMFYAKLTAGRYAYRAFAKNADTDEYDIALGGMTLDFPTDTNVDGLAGGGTNIYLQCNSFYVSTKKTDNTYFTADEYHVRVDCPIMKCSTVMGDPYVSGNYTYYPTMLYAAGNACLYNAYAYPDIEGYIFTQAINQTFRASYSAGTKSLTINTGIDLTVTVPENAEFGLYFQWNNFNTTEVAPDGLEDAAYADRWTYSGDGTKHATYFISKGNGNYTWRLSDDDHVTKAGWLGSLSESAEMSFSFDDGAPTDKLSHDFSKLGSTTINRDEADIQVNLDPTGFKAITDTTRVRAYRHWQLINSDAGNIMVEPDFEWYTIPGLDGGEPQIETVNGGNTTNNWADITPVAEDSFVAVHYYSVDVGTASVSKEGAMSIAAGSHGGFYPATSPERVGVIVIGGTGVTHGKADAKVKYNLAPGATTTRSADWDYNYDTWYYNDADPELTFTVANASGNVDVSYAMVAFDAGLNPEVKQWESAPVDNDGTYHIAVNEIFGTIGNGKGGTVIIRMEDSTGVSYRLVRAAKVTITATNVTNEGEPIMPGDQVKLSFSGMYRSVNKISGVFNPTLFKPTYYAGETKYEGTLGQYQKMDNATVTVTIPEDVEFEDGSDTAVYTFTNGYTYGSMYSAANPFAFLYNMTDAGVGTNFNAVTVNYYLHHYADAAVTVYRKALYNVKLNTMSTTGETLSGVAVTLTDAKGNACEAGENGLYILGYGTYSYTLAKDGYVVTRGTFTLGSADAEKVVDGILTVDTAKLPAAGANPWDGAAKTEPLTDEDGTYLIGTGAELAWFAAKVDSVTTAVNGKLTADIELTGYDWTPIKNFRGTLDGNGHVIYDLYINSSSYPLGLIGYLKTGASVTKLGITGDVTCNARSNAQAGGIAGYLESGASISQSFSAVNVTSKKHGGGIAGYTAGGSAITDCYATGNIATTSANECYLGGICGSYFSNTNGATLTNCYATGTVTGAKGNASYIGALSPSNNEANYVNSYYLEGTTSGESPKYGVTGKGTAKTADELKALAETLGEAFAADSQNINGGYPVLAWQNPAPEYALGDVNGDGEIDTADAALVYAYYNSKVELNAEQLARADVNGDGTVDTADAALIYAYYNGKITAFPNAQ